MKFTFKAPPGLSFSDNLIIVVKSDTILNARKKAGDIFCAVFPQYEPNHYFLGGVGLFLTKIEEE